MLARCYLYHGNDAKVLIPAIRKTKQQARQEGFANTISFEINKSFDWAQLSSSCENLDLFVAKTLVELKLEVETLNKGAASSINDFLQQYAHDQNFCIIVSAARLKPATLNSDWVKYIQKHGKIQVYNSLPPIFQLSNAILAGDQSKSVSLLNSLKKSGEDPILILWSITREIRKLLYVKYEQQASNKHQLAALKRLSLKHLQDLLRFSSKIDCTIKGIVPGNVWEPLMTLCLCIANPSNYQLNPEDTPI